MKTWKSNTPEMCRLKQELSAKAKAMNANNNSSFYDAELRRQIDENAIAQKQNDLEIKQKNLLNICSQIEPHQSHRSKPSSHCPIALTSFALETGALAPTGGNCYLQSESEDTRKSTDSVLQLVQSLEVDLDNMPNSGHYIAGIHGLGDKKFAISEALVEAASLEVGFVENSHKQFKAAHGDVTKKQPPLIFDASRSVDCPRHCQALFGRHCKLQIQDSSMYANTIGMIQSMVRVLASRRSVKVGKQFHMGPDNPWPALLVYASDGETLLRAMLACRVTFNPLDMDFIECEVCVHDSNPNVIDLRLIFEKLFDGCHCPRVDTAKDMAVFFSRLPSVPKCKVYWDYEVLEKAYANIRIRCDRHDCSSPDMIGEDSFSILLSDRNTKANKNKDLTEDDIAGLETAHKLLRNLVGSKKTSTAGNHQRKKENQSNNILVTAKPSKKRKHSTTIDNTPRSLVDS